MLNENYAYILLSDVKWWNRLCKQIRSSAGKHVFVRKSRVGPLKTKMLLFYIKRPIKQIRGKADFVERLTGNYKELWDSYGHETCLKSFAEYASFLQGRETATFIRFTNFQELDKPIPIKVITKILSTINIPRGGKYLNRETVNQLTV